MRKTKNDLEEEAGDRSLYPHTIKKKNYADDLPNRVIKRIIEEEDVD